jgi:hypothetical protein
MMEITGEIITKHRDPSCVARALHPDNLSSMVTVAGEGTVITKVHGHQLRSVIASVDDYLMNLAIAEEICSYASR